MFSQENIMNQRKQKQEGSGMEEQRVILENRNKMTVSQVVDVDAFDEETLWANLADGAVEVSGSGGQEAKGQQTPQSLGGQTAQ